MMKRFIIIICLIFSFCTSAEEVGLLSYSSNEVTRGDIVRLKIIDSRNEYYFKKYKNKRIGPLLYVVELINENEDLYFEAMISEIGPKEKLPELDDKFIVKGLNYKPSQGNQMMDFITLDIPIEIAGKASFYIYIFLLIIAFGFGLYWVKTRKSRSRKKKLKLKREKELNYLKDLFNNLSSKENIAAIYLERARILEYFEVDETGFKKTMALINSIQYQPEWPEDDYLQVQKKLKSLSEGMQEKRGI